MMTKTELLNNREILSIVINKEGFTVAHTLARARCVIEHPEVLKLKTISGLTVAGLMAEKGHKFEDPEVLKIAGDNGVTVAHIMANHGHIITNSEILKLKDNRGRSVAGAVVKKNPDIVEDIELANRFIQQAEQRNLC